MQALRKVTPKTLSTPFLRHITSRFFTIPSPDEPSSAYYDDLINAAGRNRDFATVHRLLNKRYRDGCFNTTNTFRFISTDLSILDDLSLSLAHLDRGFPRKSAYDSLVARLCKIQQTDQALRLVETMIREGYGANAATFHPILNALTRKRKMEEAWQVIELTRENDIPPDLTAYNYLLTAYCFVGDLTSAAGVLTRMAQEGMEGDTRTYDALVLGACRAGKVEAFEFVMSYGGRDKVLDTENFGLLASRLIKLRRFDDAKLVLEQMSKRGFAMEFIPKNHSYVNMLARPWTDGETVTLINAWGDHCLQLNWGNLRQKDWKEVADAVNALRNGVKPCRTDILIPMEELNRHFKEVQGREGQAGEVEVAVLSPSGTP
ncbi:hypothetical protein F0562_026248 [Nyssa sinensis]|uniref:Uncharacterized protein n=1 Tax=Nyssa sinensis TaxID=561372 RepID=A0A5J5BAY4_9ASTE|nr:hypothetical protein F0562_026248 [Nyssa sinensis]